MEFDTGNQYEYDKTKIALEELKKKIKEWLKSTYDDPSEADHTYSLMTGFVDRISKRQAHSISWVTAGSPDWHGKYYSFLSRWIKLENELGVITSKMFSIERGDDE